METHARQWDLDFRPAGYWDPNDPLTALTQNVTGELRRRMITDIVTGRARKHAAEVHGPGTPAAELLGEVALELLEDALDDDRRSALGRIHPRFMGGEYLPDYRRGEVEIARIVLESVMMDVESIRARRSKNGRIHYRVVDEYESTYECRPKSSRRPLTMRQLIGLIDGIDDGNRPPGRRYVDYTRDFNVECLEDVEDKVGFVTVRSPLYPELEAYYAAQAEEWAAKWREELNAPDGEE